MKILITGITGFAGSHLADYLLANHPEVEIYGIKRWRSKTENIEHIKDKVKYSDCDIKDAHNVYEVIDNIRPDKIFHLAGQSQVSLSFQMPEETLLHNIIPELNIFEAIRKIGISPTIVVACSSEEYGLTFKNELPMKETNPFRPLSPYAVSKIAQETLAFQYFKSYGLKTVLTRFFSIEGPGRGKDFVTSSFARQIVKIERSGEKPIISVGNLSAKRDFTDVRDMATAYWLASEKCKFGEPYNICSGSAMPIKSVLSVLLSKSIIKNIKIKQDPKKMRPSDVPVIWGDCSKFRKQTGWKPKIPFEKTMEDLLNYWREKYEYF